MRIVFAKFAKREMDEAAAFYEDRERGLGKSFRREVKKAVLRISKYPLACPVERGEVRKCLLHKFPFKLLYSIESDRIFVIAVSHHRRRPNYWVDESGQ